MRKSALGGLLMMMASVPASAQTGLPTRASVLDETAVANRATAERAADLLETRYVFPAVRARYAAALRNHAARGDYAAISTREALAERLTADLQAVAPDGHLRVYRTAAPPSPPADKQQSGSEASIAPGIRAMKWIAPGVAYLSFEHFDDRPEAMAAVAGFLRDYRGARALVIDSRENHGGAFDMMGLLANHLFGKTRHLADMDMAAAVVATFGAPFPIDGRTMRRTNGPEGLVRFQHWAMPAADRAWAGVPVYYLTSKATFSAAEHMAMILKGRATLIGETTGGGNHFGGTEPIGDGLEMFVPVGRTSDPKTGQDWEGKGVAPDVAVPAAAALDEALRRIDAAEPRVR